ncbi:PREDICTED: COMM domain-containing protein 10-like [Amphimedon queenslandica]|uniref:COMM domain-containing protein n=1 Tax=Amphimedon queenslandica TaxID=400682 RepID=A0A1X7U0Y5_AMPQE|nr:PREDICTED: COMM domain-containing protein 10-like [Amphimedon queenslandica]|eukprot:XP_003389279.1 PREDICTED: COMM domain-containing protein 10-like [Amphimedon queenslandica]
MASVVLFQPSPSLKKAAGLINEANSDTFGKILSRTLQKLHLKTDSVFSEDEIEKLQGSLGLDSQDLELLLETTVFIFQQAAYNIAKVQVLQKQLQEIGLNEEKAGLFSQIWGSHGKLVVEKLRSHQFYPSQLEETKWRLNLQMADSSFSRLKEPNAIFELTVSGKEKETEKIKLDFNHSELYQFYKQLESIQDQLDSLN